MQYLLTEEEYKKLADVNSKTRAIAEAAARDYRDRLAEAVAKILNSGMYHSFDQSHHIRSIQATFSEIKLKFDV